MRTWHRSGLPCVLAHPLLGAVGAPTPWRTADPTSDLVTGRPAEAVVLVLRRGARTVVLGPAERGDRCGLGYVDDLLRLQVAVGRFGWALHLDQVPEEVAELLDLVGLPVGARGTGS